MIGCAVDFHECISGSIGEGYGADNGLQHKPFWGYTRAAVGTGMSLSLDDKMRLEATYSLPIRKSPHDNTRAFQFGIGLTLSS